MPAGLFRSQPPAPNPMRIRLFLFCTLLPLAACDMAGPPEPGPELANGPILPVTPGNTWTYAEDGGPPFELRVGEAISVGGERYFDLVVTEGGEVSDDDEYVRAVGGGPDPLGVELHYRASAEGEVIYQEATVYRYPVAEGTYREGRRTYHVERERVTVPAGTFEVVTYSGYDGDPSVSASFAPGVGIVRFFDGQDARELTDYDVR